MAKVMPRIQDLNLPTSHFSSTQSRMWDRCQMQYYFRYVMGLKRPPGISLHRGIGVDKAATADYSHKAETGEDLPENEVKERAVAAFERSVEERGVCAAGEDKSEGELVAETKDTVAGMAGVFRRELAPQTSPVDTQVKLVVRGEGILPVVGYVDCEARGGVLLDVKTGGRKKRESDFDDDPQITSYALAFRALHDRQPSALGWQVAIETRSGNRRSQELWTRRCKADFNSLLRRYRVQQVQITQAMQSGAFVPCSPTEWVCNEKYCGFAAFADCPYYSDNGR